MFDLLYSISAILKSFGLPGICALSMAVEWRMACRFSSCTADDMGRDKSTNMALKGTRFVPGAYMDDLLLLCASPCLQSPPAPKLSLPEPRIPIMPCKEICESPAQDDVGTPLVEGLAEEDLQDDMTGYASDESVRFVVASFQDAGMLTIFS